MKMTRILLASMLAGLCLAASAQWQWVDKDGRKVFSDRAPPADVLEKDILKRPANRKRAATASAETPSEAETPATAASPLLPTSGSKATGLDKELEAKKKLALDAEAAKRKAAEAEFTKAKIESCARAKQAKATYESGARIAQINAAGQQEIMDDATRATEIRRINAIMAKDCN